MLFVLRTIRANHCALSLWRIPQKQFCEHRKTERKVAMHQRSKGMQTFIETGQFTLVAIGTFGSFISLFMCGPCAIFPAFGTLWLALYFDK